MEIHNADLYHCQKCGHVAKRLGDVAPVPECCGQKMAKAGAETVAIESPGQVELPEKGPAEGKLTSATAKG